MTVSYRSLVLERHLLQVRALRIRYRTSDIFSRPIEPVARALEAVTVRLDALPRVVS
jgi:hypothetical protein